MLEDDRTSPIMWTPKDFITNGVNCPISIIKKTMTLIRSAANAEWILMLVYQQEPVRLNSFQDPPEIVTKDKFFQSLALLVHQTPQIQMRADETDVVQRKLAGSIGAPPAGTIPPDKVTTLPILPEWIDLLTRNGSKSLKALWVGDLNDRPSSPSTGYPSRICLITPAAGESRLRDLQRTLLDDLLTMLDSSVPVVAHRNFGRIKIAELVIAHFEEKFAIERLVNESISSEDYRKLTESFGESVLRAALTLTGSSIGNLYLSTSDQRSLALVSQVHNDTAIPKLSLNDPQSVVSFVYSTAKPLLINDLIDFRRTHPNVSYKWVGDNSDKVPYAELAIPIIHPNPESCTPNILGVLNIEKASPNDRGFYSDHDIGILRMLALRFCLWRLGLAAAMENRSLARIAPWDKSYDAHADERMTIAVDHRIPYDFRCVRSQLSDVLRQAYYLTRSKTATIRLLSIDARCLIRFCAWPDDVMTHAHHAIPIKRLDSVNAFVARSGEPCYLKDLHKRESLMRYRELSNVLTARKGIRSEYCLPIKIRGRLVGTLNLESEYIDAYSGERHFIGAVVGQVQLALSFAQSWHEQSVLSVSARVTLNAHELMKCIDTLEDLVDLAPSDLKSALQDLIARLKLCLVPSRGAEPRTANNSVAKRTGYRDVIQDLAESKNIAHLIKWTGDPEAMVDDRISETSSSIMSLVLSEVLANSFLQATAVPNGFIRISLKNTSRGGRAYKVILISHPVSVRIGKNDIGKLYRVPVHKADRTHIGAFLAGAMVRSIGGDITFSISWKDAFATTAIEVPVHQDAEKENTADGHI